MSKKTIRKMIGRKYSTQHRDVSHTLFKNKLFYSEKYYYSSSLQNELIIKYGLNTKNNICFRDHVVNGKPCLPTDAYLELIYVACQSYLKFDKIEMNKIVMSNPIVTNGDEEIVVRLHLVKNDKNYYIKLVSDDPVTKREIIHLRGVVSNYNDNILQDRDLSLKGDIIENFNVEYFHKNESHIYLGEFYQALRSLKFYHDHAIGEISISKLEDGFSINPSIISAALGSAITFSSFCIGEKFYNSSHYFLPYSIDGLKLYAPLSGKNYRCVIKLLKHTKKSVECCLQIINENNKLVFVIENFRLQKLSSDKVIENQNFGLEHVIPKNKALDESAINEDVAIIGIACRFPKSNHTTDFWKLLKNSQDCITEVPNNRWLEFDDWYNQEHGETISKYGGFIESFDRFDPLFFNISPADAETMDPQQRIFLEEAWSAIENAGYAPSSLSNMKCGVYVGCAEGDYTHVLAKANKSAEAQSFPGTSSGVLAARISYLLNLKGPSMAIDTSCSSSLTAIHLAAESIKSGENELAIAGGINIFSTPLKQVLTSQIGMQSKDGRCHTFDQAANGTVFSEGCGVIILKRLSKAIEDRDHIWGVIKASGINQDGKTNGITAPSAISQENLLSDIYHKYHIKPEKISYIEAHGTGTVLGDPIEVQGLRGAFEKLTHKKNFCAIGSLKSNMGHAVYAAGVAGLIKVLLCMKHKQLVPSIHYNNTNKNIDFDSSPFFVNKQNRYWETNSDSKRMAAVSSFGFSGSNAHIVVEDYPNDSTDQLSIDRSFIIPLSAKSSLALNRNIFNLYSFLSDPENLSAEINIINIAYTLQLGRDAMNYRAVFIADNLHDLMEKLSLFLNGKATLSISNNIFLGHLKNNQALSQNAIVTQDVIASWLAQGNFVKIAEHWIAGNKIPWQLFYKNLTPYKVALPSYAFEEERYWPKLAIPFDSKNKAELGNHNTESKSVVTTSFSLKPVAIHHSNVNIDLLGKIENDLVRLIHQLLQIPLEKIDVNVHLTQFGFDSVNLVKYARVLSEYFNLPITPAKLFSHPTVATIAKYLQEENLEEMNHFYGTYISPINDNNKSHDESINADYMFLEEITTNDDAHKVHEPIAIIGMSGKFPKSCDLTQYWENLLEGKDCISEIPEERWNWRDYYSKSPENENKTDAIWGGFIDDIKKFDPHFFGMSEQEAEMLDPQQRLLLKYVYKAIENAGYHPKTLSNKPIGVFTAIGSNGYDDIVKRSGKLLNSHFLTGTLPSAGPNRISYFFDFHGPSEPIETACASSLVAINRAFNEINNNVCDIAIVGGVNVIVTPHGHIAFNKAGFLSKEGRCKPFSASADGFVRAEGVGVLVLKRLSSAEKDHDQIYGVIKGVGVNHNGKSNFLTAPNPQAQSDLLESVYRKANIDINTVTYIETHGTGTELGDAIEIEGLKSAFKNLDCSQVFKKDGPHCGIGSVKSNIGHTELTSGIASMIKVLYQMKANTLIKTLHCDSINPYLQLENSPFYIVKENQKWETLKDEAGISLPHRAGISAFGLNGVNAHVILEGYVDNRVKAESNELEQLIVISAKNPVQLKSMVKELHTFLIKQTDIALTDVAFTLQQGRETMPARLAIVVNSIESLLIALENYSKGILTHNSSVIYFNDTNEKKSETQFLFQGTAGTYFLQELIKTNDLKRLALCWVNGAEIAFDQLPKNEIVRRVSLPGYQFCESDYWVTQEKYQPNLEIQNEKNNTRKKQSDNLNNTNMNKLYLRWYEEAEV